MFDITQLLNTYLIRGIFVNFIIMLSSLMSRNNKSSKSKWICVAYLMTEFITLSFLVITRATLLNFHQHSIVDNPLGRPDKFVILYDIVL
jgi:formate/nitrite transporter FocA (FNT family)